jgi:glycosyltransferase involved in cell wall biosynthesis
VARVPICIVQPARHVISETFLQAHAERLPASVTVIDGVPPQIDGTPILSPGLLARGWRRLRGIAVLERTTSELDRAYLRAFRSRQARAVLAEYGPTGVRVLEACRRAAVPLVVHFHGYDASQEAVLTANADGYRRMFAQAAALVVVSVAMRDKLLALGAPAEKVHVNACGVDCRVFYATNPARNAPVFLTTGRFVEKKGPHLTILAFAEASRRLPAIRLRMIGEGPLRPACEQIAQAVGVGHAVTFLGGQSHQVVAEEMRRARAFLQHSIQASDGDSEGTPVAILEAQASGLPVIATRHAGIPDVVLDSRTGFLLAEGDVSGMAEKIERLGQDGDLATELGAAGRSHVLQCFTMERSVASLWRIIEQAIAKRA